MAGSFIMPERRCTMAHAQTVLRVDLDPTRPVPEAVAAVQALINLNPSQEEAILLGVQEAISRRLEQMKGVDKVD